MSIENDKIINNDDILIKNKNEIGLKSNINNHILMKKNKKIFNIDKLISKVNFSHSRNRKANQKNIFTEELFTNKLNSRNFRKNESKNHKKNLTNIYDAESLTYKPDYELKKLTEKKILENKMHRRIQTERQNIEINKKINKNGNRQVLLNSMNTKKNNGITTKYLFERRIL